MEPSQKRPQVGRAIPGDGVDSLQVQTAIPVDDQVAKAGRSAEPSGQILRQGPSFGEAMEGVG